MLIVLWGQNHVSLFQVFYLESENSVDTFSLTDGLKALGSLATSFLVDVWAGARFSLTSPSTEAVGCIQSNIGSFLDQYG